MHHILLSYCSFNTPSVFFLKAMAALQQAQADGLCLRYPDSLGQHPTIDFTTAAQMLLRAIQLSQHTPFQWGYIDKPGGTYI